MRTATVRSRWPSAPLAKSTSDEPAVGAEALGEPASHLDDLAAEEARGVDQMAAMRQHVVAAQVGLGIARGPARLPRW